MFEQSFVGLAAKPNRGWPVVASLALQFSLVGAGLLIPLLNPDMLPRAVIATFLTTPSLPPPARPAAPPVIESVARTLQRVVRDGFFAPPAIPRKVAIIDDIDLAPHAATSGVVGLADFGPSTGRPDGVIGSLASTTPPPAPPPPVVEAAKQAAPPIPRIAAGGVVQEALLINKVIPVYPILARNARVQGTVVFKAVISTGGLIQSLNFVSGPPLLVRAATDAVRQWRYRPTLLNGVPCEVDTTIQVTFTLNQ